VSLRPPGRARKPAPHQFDISPPIKHSFLGALVGAVILLLIYGFVRGRTSKTKT
jgi:Transglycosylase associated protein